MATAKIAELKEKLEAACSFLQDTTARRESERQRLQRQIEVSDKLFEGLCRRAQTDVENIETELKAEIKKDRDNWQQWSDAELIRRWEEGDFDYAYFKDVHNAKRLRSAYKSCAPDAPPRSVSRIMRISAQVGAGWYKTPLEAPHCNPPSTKNSTAPAKLRKKAASKNKISGSTQSANISATPPAQLSKDTASKKKNSGGAQSLKTSVAPSAEPSEGSAPKNKISGKSASKPTSNPDGAAAGTSTPPQKRSRDSATKDSQKVLGTTTGEGQDQEYPSKKRC